MILSKRRNRIIDGIDKSLALLRSEMGIKRITSEFENADDTRQVENKINRAFLFCLRDIFQKIYNINPIQEQTIQPKTDTPYSASEQKKPDFSLELNDDLNDGVFFHIECKRLGSATSGSWKYNEKYVENGIYRFTTDTFCYGIDSPSGAMVGYIEDMELEDILTQVNKTIDQKLKIDKLAKITDWQEKLTTHLNHSFERSFEKSPFILHHLWIDLRDCYPRC